MISRLKQKLMMMQRMTLTSNRDVMKRAGEIRPFFIGIAAKDIYRYLNHTLLMP